MHSRQRMVQRPPAVVRLGRWRHLLVAVVLGGAAYLFLAGDDGLFRLRERRRELEEVEVEAARLAAENDSLRQVLWRLENDLDYVEKVAREEYGLSKKGERVYRLPPQEAGEKE